MYFFAYGANMDPHRMTQTCPDARAVGPARAEGFRLAFNVYSPYWGGGAANIEPDEERKVWGVVWDVTPEDLGRLDTFRGHPTFYRREDVVVKTPSDDELIAVTYRVAHQNAFVPPTDAYLLRMRAGMRVHGLPPEALDEAERLARPPSPTIS